MEKALWRVRNSYNDYRDQCLSSSNRKREFGLPDMFYVESLLQANGVESTDVQHPAMPDSFGLATGIPFGLFVVRAFEKFDACLCNKGCYQIQKLGHPNSKLLWENAVILFSEKP